MDGPRFTELKNLVDKTIFYHNKTEEYKDMILDYLKEMGYINDQVILNAVTNIILNTNGTKTTDEYIDELFKVLNVEGNF